MTSANRRLVLRPSIIREEVNGEVVLLDMESDQFASLNKTGAACLDLLLTSETLDAAATELSQRFEVDVEQALTDLRHILKDLLNGRILQIEGGAT